LLLFVGMFYVRLTDFEFQSKRIVVCVCVCLCFGLGCLAPEERTASVSGVDFSQTARSEEGYC